MGAAAYSWIVAAAFFFGVLSIAVLLALLYSTRAERRVQRRLDPNKAASDDFAAAGDRPVLQEIARQGRAIEQMVDTQGETNRLLIQAGWRDAQSRMMYYALRALMPVAFVGLALVGAVVGKGKIFQPPLVYLVVVIALGLSILLPIRLLRGFAESRSKRIRREVPLFVHLLMMLYDAGLSTRQAFANLVREGGGVLPELGYEVQLVLRQIEAGADISEALKNMGDALQVDDLASVLGVLRQVDRYGGEIREPLGDTLKLIEERHALEVREQVNLTSGRMTVVMVLFFFPALLVFTAGPAFMAILKGLHGVATGK
jgi:tight adherence protein C